MAFETTNNLVLPLNDDHNDHNDEFALLDPSLIVHRYAQETRLYNDYMNLNQSNINFRMRTILVSWLVELLHAKRYHLGTLSLAIQLIDRYGSVHDDIKRQNLQAVGVCAFSLAAKLLEYAAPSLTDLSYATDKAYSVQHLKELEMDIASALDWRLQSSPTVTDFVYYYYDILSEDDHIKPERSKSDGIELPNLLEMVVCTSLYHYYLCITYKASAIARACIVLYVYLKKWEQDRRFSFRVFHATYFHGRPYQKKIVRKLAKYMSSVSSTDTISISDFLDETYQLDQYIPALRDIIT